MQNPISYNKQGGQTPWGFTWQGLYYAFATYGAAMHFWASLYANAYRGTQAGNGASKAGAVHSAIYGQAKG